MSEPAESSAPDIVSILRAKVRGSYTKMTQANMSPEKISALLKRWGDEGGSVEDYLLTGTPEAYTKAGSLISANLKRLQTQRNT